MALDQVTSGGNGTLSNNANAAAFGARGRRGRNTDAGGSLDQDTASASDQAPLQEREQGAFQNPTQDQGTYQEGYQEDHQHQDSAEGNLQGQREYDPDKLFQTFMEGNNVHARLSPSRVNGLLRVARDLDIDLRPKGQIDQKIVRDSLVTGAVAGAVIGLTMGAKAGLAGLIGTAAATMLVKVCEVDVRIAGEQDAQPLLSFQPNQ